MTQRMLFVQSGKEKKTNLHYIETTSNWFRRERVEIFSHGGRVLCVNGIGVITLAVRNDMFPSVNIMT